MHLFLEILKLILQYVAGPLASVWLQNRLKSNSKHTRKPRRKIVR
jgi:hypothetical protein